MDKAQATTKEQYLEMVKKQMVEGIRNVKTREEVDKEDEIQLIKEMQLNMFYSIMLDIEEYVGFENEEEAEVIQELIDDYGLTSEDRMILHFKYLYGKGIDLWNGMEFKTEEDEELE